MLLASIGRWWSADRRAEGAKRRRVLVTLMVATLAAICVVAVLVMAEARRDVGRSVAVSAGNLAAAVAHDVDRNIELLDLSLQAAAKGWSNPDIQSLAAPLRKMVLFDSSASAEDIGPVFILDETGSVQAVSKMEVAIGMNFADRDYFRVHANTNAIGLFVSKPFISRISGNWQVALSRRIDKPDGSFAGVVATSLQLDYLSKLYKGLDLGDEGTITLFRMDGRVITREPYVENDIRRSLGGTDAFNRIRPLRSGSFEGESPVDGARRIISFHRVGNLPLIQDVEVSVDQAYADWLRRAAITGGALFFLCLSSLVLMLMLDVELTKRVAVEKALERLATTDGLTGLPNRRRFGEALQMEWTRASDTGSPLSLLMIDADSFKAYNDLYGHPAGDSLLQSFARCLTDNARRIGDLACRYGGEEFAVLLADTDAAGALRVAETIRGEIVGLAHDHPGTPSQLATVSIGVATVRPGPGQTSERLLLAADASLYRAKAAGRNCCRVAAMVNEELVARGSRRVA